MIALDSCNGEGVRSSFNSSSLKHHLTRSSFNSSSLKHHLTFDFNSSSLTHHLTFDFRPVVETGPGPGGTQLAIAWREVLCGRTSTKEGRHMLREKTRLHQGSTRLHVAIWAQAVPFSCCTRLHQGSCAIFVLHPAPPMTKHQRHELYLTRFTRLHQ